jgi:hypothetical protein
VSVLVQQRRLDDIDLQLKGLVHVRALLETRGASSAELRSHDDEIARVRAELARFEKADAAARAARALKARLLWARAAVRKVDV